MARWKVGVEFWWFWGAWSSLEKESDFLAPAVALKGRYSNGFLLEQLELKAKMGVTCKKTHPKKWDKNFFWGFSSGTCCAKWQMLHPWVGLKPHSYLATITRWSRSQVVLGYFCPPMQQHVGSFVTPYLSFNVVYECTCASIFIRLFACYLSIIYLFLSTSISKEYWYIIPLTYSAYMSCDSRSFICSSSNPDCNILCNPQISTQFLLG